MQKSLRYVVWMCFQTLFYPRNQMTQVALTDELLNSNSYFSPLINLEGQDVPNSYVAHLLCKDIV